MKEGIKHFHNLQYRWLGLDGQPIWINCRGRTVNDENGNPMCMVGCINEIGAKQKADNVSGLLGLRPPTADYGVTLPLGLITFGMIHYCGIKKNKVNTPCIDTHR